MNGQLRILFRFLVPAFLTLAGMVAPSALTAQRSPLPDAQNVELVGQIGGDGELYAFDVVVSGRTAYVVDLYGNLHVIDVSDPAALSQIGLHEIVTCDFPGCVTGMVMIEDVLYLVDFSGELHLVDASNSAFPVKLGTYMILGSIRGIAVEGDVAYVGSNVGGLNIIDVSNSESPSEIGLYQKVGRVMGVLNSIVLFGTSSPPQEGLQLIDVSIPANPTEADNYYGYFGALDTDIDRDIAYVADVDDGDIHALDVSNPNAIVRLGSYDPPVSWRVDTLETVDKVLHVGARSRGLHLIDFSNAADPVELGRYDTPGQLSKVVVVNDLAYIADGQGGLLILRYTGNDGTGIPAPHIQTPSPSLVPDTPTPTVIPVAAVPTPEPAERGGGEAASDSGLSDPGEQPGNTGTTGNMSFVIRGLSGFVVLVVGTLLLRRRRRKVTQPEAIEDRFCIHCGAEYPPFGRYCIKCGREREPRS